MHFVSTASRWSSSLPSRFARQTALFVVPPATGHGATHFLMKTLPKVATEMALHVLAYNMKRVMSILGVGGLMECDPGLRQAARANWPHHTVWVGKGQ
jgi:hypothetical protein